MKRFVGWIALFSLVSLANCGGGGEGAGNASCRGKLIIYESCGVWEGGDANCHQLPETHFQECEAQCINDMSCLQVVDYVCEDEPNNCILNCRNQNFACSNGQTVDSVEQCDGFPDCDDGSDEGPACNPSIFRCGQFFDDIPGTMVCDGNFDCPNGEDEENCGEPICSE